MREKMWVTKLRELALNKNQTNQTLPPRPPKKPKTLSQNKIIKVKNVLWLFILTSTVWV